MIVTVSFTGNTEKPWDERQQLRAAQAIARALFPDAFVNLTPMFKNLEDIGATGELTVSVGTQTFTGRVAQEWSGDLL